MKSTWRRFLFACWWTGARPGELAAARWCDVDWQGGRIVLQKHKTAKKTGKPRVIYCPPAMMRLLRWMDRDRFSLLALAVYELLREGPQKVNQIVRRLATVHPSARSLLFPRVRRRLATDLVAVSGWNRPWALKPGSRPPAFCGEERIFTNYFGGRITRRAWGLAMLRARRRTGCMFSLYAVRRAFAHRCLRLGLSLKATSLLMGHTNSEMLEKCYLSALGDDEDMLRKTINASVARADASAAQPGVFGE